MANDPASPDRRLLPPRRRRHREVGVGELDYARAALVVGAAVWFLLMLGSGRARWIREHRGSWWSPVALFLAGSAVDAALPPSGTLIGPTLLAMWFALTAPRRGEAASMYLIAALFRAVTVRVLRRRGWPSARPRRRRHRTLGGARAAAGSRRRSGRSLQLTPGSKRSSQSCSRGPALVCGQPQAECKQLPENGAGVSVSGTMLGPRVQRPRGDRASTWRKRSQCSTWRSTTLQGTLEANPPPVPRRLHAAAWRRRIDCQRLPTADSCAAPGKCPPTRSTCCPDVAC
jgi:hypothetical protein